MATDSDASSSSPAPTSLVAKQRRTRTRISQSQLTALENLYSRASHPSQEEREKLARLISMEAKRVTIWFQNRRQAARRQELHEAIVQSNGLGMSVEHLVQLDEAHSRGRASPVTPELIATPPAAAGDDDGNDEQFSNFASSCPHSPAIMTAEPAWLPRGSPNITQKQLDGKKNKPSSLDADHFAAALALAQMRSVDSPVA